jgi:hypothetical protein
MQEAIALAKLWPGQNHLVIWLLSPLLVCAVGVFGLALLPFLTSLESGLVATLGTFYLIVFTAAAVLLSPGAAIMALNIVSVVLAVTVGLPGIAGMRGTFIDDPSLLFNTTLIALTIALVYLLLDPVLKAAYVLRCYYGRSLHSGADVRTQLRRARRRPLDIAVAFALIFFGAMTTSFAQPTAEVPSGSIVAEQLNDALDQELAKRVYTWRMPREPEPNDDSLFILTLKELANQAEDFVKWVFEGIGNIVDRILDWFRGSGQSPSEAGGLGGIQTTLKISLVILSIALGAVLAYFLVKLWQSRRPEKFEALEAAPAAIPDIEDEDTRADALPTDEWHKMALDFIAQKDYRKAVRAVFLGMLAHLAQRDLVYIARYKSNREYTHELERRGRHAVADLRTAFGGGVSIYEAAWYGGRDVTEDQIARILAHRENLLAEDLQVQQGMNDA